MLLAGECGVLIVNSLMKRVPRQFSSGMSTAAAGGGRGGFSLVELLVVVAIVGVLAGVSVPLLGRMNGEAAVGQAAAAVASGVEQARVLAKARGARAAMVVLPVEQGGQGGKVTGRQRFGIFLEEEGKWQVDGGWLELPAGVWIATAGNGGTARTGVLDGAAGGGRSVSVKIDRDQELVVPAVVFGPRGSVEWGREDGAEEGEAGLQAVATSEGGNPGSEETGRTGPELRNWLTVWVVPAEVDGEKLRVDGASGGDGAERGRGVRIQPLTGATELVWAADSTGEGQP